MSPGDRTAHPDSRSRPGGDEVWLIRHGESVANAGAATSDYAAIPLTPLGHSQAQSFAAACPGQPDWVACSAYLRAQQTAAPLLERFPDAELVDAPVHEFTYLEPERCVGLSPTTRKPLVQAYWSRMDPSYSDGPGAESFSALWQRAGRFLDGAAGRPGFGVVFSHEQFIRAVLLTASYTTHGSPPELMRRFYALRSGLPIGNAAVVRLRFGSGRWWSGGIDRRHL